MCCSPWIWGVSRVGRCRYTKDSSFIKSEKSLLVEAMKPFLLRFGIKLSLN